jgi:hypothetical protein
MKIKNLFLFVFFIILIGKSYGQNFKIIQHPPEFNGKELLIKYDITSERQDDQFCVWVEISKKNGEIILSSSLTGDIGVTKTGNDKKIIWIPGKDSVFINEEVLIEIKAEKYIKSFNKGSMMLASTLVPGLGQTMINKGKPYWLTGVAAYGALAGGLIFRSSSVKTYDSYLSNDNNSNREDLYNKAQTQMNISSGLIVSAAALWIANLIWVAATPNSYQPLQHVRVSVNQSTGPGERTALLTLKINF